MRIYLAFILVFGLSAPALADNHDLDGSVDTEDSLGQVVEQSVERRTIDEAAIDTENLEVTAFAGFISIEDFGVSSVAGGKIAYHLSENLFVEGTVGTSTANETTFERLNGDIQLLTDDQRDYTFYNISVGYNLLGETFIGDDYAFNTAVYVIAGAGSTEFAGDSLFTFNFGSGYRFLINDSFAFHIDFRDHVFDLDLLGESKTAHNLELSIGASLFF
ncbi:MAG: outer membrane beta-barrel domain-containing protein [Pseudomonadota bacterium]